MSTFGASRLLFIVIFFAVTMSFMTDARSLTMKRPFATNLLMRLKLDNESSNCWDYLIEIQSCTGEIILFFMNGETYIGHACCEAISTIAKYCWPHMIETLGFTTKEGNILEGYCDHKYEKVPSSMEELKVALRKSWVP